MGITQSFRTDGTVISAVASHWKSPAQRDRAYEDIPQDGRLCPEVERAAGGSHVMLTEACRAMDAAQAEVDRLYARWQELEGKRAG